LNRVSASAPARAVNPQWVRLTKAIRPKRPTTIEGTELIASSANRIVEVSLVVGRVLGHVDPGQEAQRDRDEHRQDQHVQRIE
jgi:hypothetical protein